MKKLIGGILDFRKNILPHRIDTFARLATGQQPDALFITCSDSRVAPNWFASTDPGDLFVIRNVGNLVPPCGDQNHSVAAAIEFSVLNLNVSDIVVCGHSGCGAIHALCEGIEKVPSKHLKEWLRFGESSLKFSADQITTDPILSKEDKVSQCNVLQQIQNLQTYPLIQENMKNKKMRLHAWWFQIARGSVHAFNSKLNKFELIGEDNLAEA